jgi:protein SCO1/2
MVFGGHVFAGPLPSYDRVRILEPAVPLKDVTLINTTNEPFVLSSLKGNVALVFFGFTNCPDICPLTMQRLSELYLSGTVDTNNTVFILVSVDGDRDTPELMKQFLSAFPADFVGLTGSPKDVKKLTSQFRAPFYKGNEAGTAQPGYTVAHSPQVYAVDADGALRAEFYNASLEAMAGVTAALNAENNADHPEIAARN